jgi:precorrin-6A/cobalt-precorrin-6A reductase
MESHGTIDPFAALILLDSMALKILILGGTTEARLLAEQLAHDPHYDVLVSYAGRTISVRSPGTPYRVGGFGGVDGLTAFLKTHRFQGVIDATHPYAARISSNAAQACFMAYVPLLRLERPAWNRMEGDIWTEVDNMHHAARAIGCSPRRVFLSIGRLELSAFFVAPRHEYFIRTIDCGNAPVELPRVHMLFGRGPFCFEEEKAFLEREAIEIVVSKNSGSKATYAKIEAARVLRIPVIMIKRPANEAVVYGDPEVAIDWLRKLHETSFSDRGE